MRVDAERHLDPLVTETLLDLWRDACLEQERRGGMPEPVQRDRTDACGLDDARELTLPRLFACSGSPNASSRPWRCPHSFAKTSPRSE
jgi:hypothetical protein